MADLNAVAIGQFLEILRKLVGARHPRALDEDRHYGDVAPECRRGFETDEVKGIVESSLTGRILGIEPISANDRQQDATGGNALVNGLAKVSPDLNGRDVHEDRVFAKLSDKVVVQTSRLAFSIIATVTDKNCRHEQPFASLPSVVRAAWTLYPYA